MANNIQVANEVTDRLSLRDHDHLIATLGVWRTHGAAYTAGKGFFRSIIPAIKKLQAAVDDLPSGLNSYRIADASRCQVWQPRSGSAEEDKRGERETLHSISSSHLRTVE